MPITGWKSISIPEKLFDEIEEYIKVHKEYTSISEYVREAVRWKIATIEATKKEAS